MNTIKNKKIAIIGGGPGGLTLARLLQLQGVEVKVYERDLNKDARQQGATLDLHHESGLRAIREAGLMEAFKANYRPGADKFRVLNKAAEIILADDMSKEEGVRFRPEIDRGPLQTILFDSLLPDTVVWDSHFISLIKLDNQWKVEFKNGNSILADIVIAADGANSKVRPYITPIKPFYVGITAIEASVYNSETACPQIHKLLNGGKIFGLDDSRSLFVSAKGDGSIQFYPGFKSDENWFRNCGIDFTKKEQMLQWFKKEYAGWDKAWHELFENASTNFIPRPQYCMPLDQSWESLPNLIMIGDAAHLMPPYAGEGVNMAMLDAVELSHSLTSAEFADTQSAIAAYEKQMLARASATAGFTLQSTAALHGPNAIDYLISVIS